MEPGSQCIGPGDPAFVAALALGVVAAVVLGVLLARLERTLTNHSVWNWRRHVAWLLGLAAAFGGPIALTALFDSWLHPGRPLCTSMVGQWFFLPPAVVFATGVVFGVLEARQRTARPGQASGPGA